MLLGVRKLVSILFLSTIVTSMNATKVYNINPSVDLVELVKQLKIYTEDNVVINLASGTYYINEPIRFNVEHRVSIRIEGQGRAVISGAIPLTAWEEMPNGLWKTKSPVSYNIQQLIVNGTLACRAKTPNDGNYYFQQGQIINKEGNDIVYKVYLPYDLSEELKKIQPGEKPLVNLFRLFTHSKTDILSYSITERSITFKEQYIQPYFTPNGSTGFFLENYFAALDFPGEWYQDIDGTIYYLPRDGETINTAIISAPKLLNLVTISGAPENLAGNITFSGVVFEGSDVVGSCQNFPPYQSAYTLDGALLAVYSKDINIINCEFRCMGGYSIWMLENCEYCTIQRNYIHDVGGGGIKIGGLKKDSGYASHNIDVNNNVIERFGRIYMGSSGVFLTYAYDCNISHNDISDGYYTGISAGFSWGYGDTPTHNNSISYNRIGNLGQGLLNDMAGIYTLGVSPGTIISNNVISDIESSSCDGFGIYTDEGSSDILIEKNVAYNCTGGGFHQHYGSNNTVRNNIFAYGEKANLLISSVKKPEDVQLTFEHNIVLVSDGEAITGDALKNGKFIFKDNCFYDVNGQGLTVNGKSLNNWMEENHFSFKTDDPRLKNPEQGNFKFKSKRIARKIGFKSIKTTKAGANWHPQTN